jgi:chromate reductase, NAD(P)H dehydrogenase (quinone)
VSQGDRSVRRPPAGRVWGLAAVEVAMVTTSWMLLISGSLRSNSTNTAVLRTAQASAPEGVGTVLYEGLAGLPHFNPDDDADPLPSAVADLRASVHAADALVLSVPEYAGAMPGSFKNLLDWLIGDDQPGSIAGKPVAWINASPRGAINAHDSLRKVLGYASATIVESACVEVPVTTTMIGADGLIADLATRERITGALTTLAREDEGRDSTEETGIS